MPSLPVWEAIPAVLTLTAPSGPTPVGEEPRVNPGLSFLGHFGPQIGNIYSKTIQPSGRRTIAISP
jgi:hypothetical protein